MADPIGIFIRRWKFIALLTLAATVLALVISLLRPKEYTASATALPSNSLITDKARIFNTGIEALYPEIGTPDELDRIEGSAKLDTIFIHVSKAFDLVPHYQISPSDEAIYHAANTLKKNTEIRRSAYGELKIQVWDGDAELAANVANALLDALNELHQQVQTVNNKRVLENLKKGLAQKQAQLDSIHADVRNYGGPSVNPPNDTLLNRQRKQIYSLPSTQLMQEQIAQYQKLISEYELAVGTMPQALIAVERARPSLFPDKPKVLQTVLLAFGASLLFSFLLAAYTENRRQHQK